MSRFQRRWTLAEARGWSASATPGLRPPHALAIATAASPAAVTPSAPFALAPHIPHWAFSAARPWDARGDPPSHRTLEEQAVDPTLTWGNESPGLR